VVVLRAPLKSGSLHTARHALEQWRPLWVLPGEVGNPKAAGCLLLLKKKEARLAHSPDDIISSLSLPLPPPLPPGEEPHFPLPPPAKEKPHFSLFPPGEEGRAAFCTLPAEEEGCSPVESFSPACEGGAGQWGEEAAFDALGEEARQVLAQLEETRLFEELLASTRMDSASLSAALCELELSGRVVQKPGKRYARIGEANIPP
jgi:DNA processing protein